jgi:uncharacterized cupredoxin-like copper-binding protein
MADEHDDESRKNETRDRLLLPLILPIIIFLFAVLVIYGLSRIYLDLSHVEFGDEVNAATPLAIGVALGILGVCWYLVSNPRLPGWAIGGIIVAAGLLLTGGSIISAVVDEPEEEAHANGEPTPPPSGDGITVELDEFTVVPNPATTGAGQVTFTASNVGSITHNLRVIATDLAPDALPVTGDATVDESAVDVVASSDDIDPEAQEELTAELAEGTYVLICNVPSHYDGGMHAGFTVGPPAPPSEGEPPAGEGVTTDLSEFSVSADPANVPAGPTSFTVNNTGAIVHNLRVISTDEAPDALPVTGDDMVDEAALDVVAESDDIDPGDSETIEVDLAEGSYVLICNIATHYGAGMRTGFTVGPAPGGAPP